MKIQCLTPDVHKAYEDCPQVMDAPAKLDHKKQTRPYVWMEIDEEMKIKGKWKWVAIPLIHGKANHPYCFADQYRKSDGTCVPWKLDFSKALLILDDSFMGKSARLPDRQFYDLKKNERKIADKVRKYIDRYSKARAKEKNGQALTNSEINLLKYSTLQYVEWALGIR